jgi:hypothetical protein
MKEVQVPVLDHYTTGVVNEGDKVYYIRAGGYDTKLHFIGDIDKRPVEADIPFYYSRGFKGSIDNVEVKEINENWTFASEEGGSSYIDNDTGVIVTNGIDAAHRGVAHISFDVIEGDNYKLFIDIDRPTDSVIKIGPAPDNNQYAEMLIPIWEDTGNLYTQQGLGTVGDDLALEAINDEILNSGFGATTIDKVLHDLIIEYAGDYQRGDINGDDEINVNDVLYTLRFITDLEDNEWIRTKILAPMRADLNKYGSYFGLVKNSISHRDMIFTAGATGVCYLTLATTGNGFTYWDNISVRTIPNLSSDEYLLLGRALNVFGMPIGGESRWKQHNTDAENLDFNGRVIAGFRTIESFGENILETYYDDVTDVIDNTIV